MAIETWRQLNCFRCEDHSDLVNTFPAEHRAEGNELFVILTHSCSVSSKNFGSEPYAEYIVARPIDELSPSKMNRRERRELHLSIWINDKEEFFSILIHERAFFDRDFLDEFDSLDGYHIPQKEELLRWITDRYTLPAHPDKLEKRLKNLKAKIKKLFNTTLPSQNIAPQFIYEILFDYLPIEEAPEGEPYKIKFLILVNIGHEEDKAADELKKAIMDWFSKSGYQNQVELREEVIVVGVNNINYYEHQTEWDYFDINGVDGSGS